MKNLVIIFDGPDRVGKSIISRELSKVLDIPRFKNENESKSFLKDPDYFQNALRYADPYFASYLKQTGASVILDRSYPSEFVYAKAFCRQTDEEALRRVDTMFAELGAFIILPRRRSYEGLQDDQFDMIDASMLKKIDALYDEFFEWSNCRRMRLDVDDENLSDEIQEILTFINSFGETW